MPEDTQQTRTPEQEPIFSVVTVPQQMQQQVHDFVKQLTEGEDDTSAYMLSLGGAHVTGTNCTAVKSDNGYYDMSCKDAV